jgi:hypothetical protein
MSLGRNAWAGLSLGLQGGGGGWTQRQGKKQQKNSKICVGLYVYMYSLITTHDPPVKQLRSRMFSAIILFTHLFLYTV